MENCPKIYVGRPEHSFDFSKYNFHFDSEQKQLMEDCCRSNYMCDVQKRAESIDTKSIDENVRHCDCENQFLECIDKSDSFMVLKWAEHYFMHTPKCYALDQPINTCNEYKCYYLPNAPYKQYPRDHKNGAIRCVVYDLDGSKPKMYQTFDMPFYYGAHSADELIWIERDGNVCEKEVY